MTQHRENLKSYLAKIELKDQIVADWGSGTKPASRYIQHQNCHFTTIDKHPNLPDDRKGDEHFIFDVTKLLAIQSPADVAFCIEAIEHVKDTDALLINIIRNLKPHGLLYISVPFMFEQHSDEDYYRFTELGVHLILERKGFEILELDAFENNTGFFVKARLT